MMPEDITKIAKKSRGFTMIELTVSIGLMVILLAMISVIFQQANGIFTLIQARLQIYQSARTSFDFLSKDFASFIPSATGNQRFSVLNVQSSGDLNDIDQAKDEIAFRTMASTDKNVVVPVEVHYLLIRENDPTFLTANNKGNPKTLKRNRDIFVLRRIVRRIDASTGFLLGEVLEISDLCHYTTSFNIELLYEDPKAKTPPKFMNILSLPSEYRNQDSLSAAPYPLGDAPVGEAGLNTISEPAIPKAVRVTLRVIDSAVEKQERVFIKVFKIG